jgi:hypothetical protein
VQATFRNDGSEPLFVTPLEYVNGWRDLVNRVNIDVVPYTAGAVATVWTGPDVVSVNSGSTHKIVATPPSTIAAFVDVIAPVEDTDYLVPPGGGNPTVTIDSTEGTAITVSVVASATGNARIRNLQLRAQPFTANDPFQITSQSTASQDTYRRIQTYNYDAPWLDENTAVDLTKAIVQDNKDPRPGVRFTVSNLNATREAQQWGRKIGDRIRVVDTRSGIDLTGWIDRRETSILDAGKTVYTTYTVRAVTTGLVGTTEVFILNSTSQGVLDTNKLGY